MSLKKIAADFFGRFLDAQPSFKYRDSVKYILKKSTSPAIRICDTPKATSGPLLGRLGPSNEGHLRIVRSSMALVFHLPNALEPFHNPNALGDSLPTRTQVYFQSLLRRVEPPNAVPGDSR